MKTSEVDENKWLTSKERISLVKKLNIDGQTSCMRGVLISKKRNEIKSLGIPVIEDKAKQTLVLMALEPEWEAKFEPNSYGFRIGRSTHDAVEALRLSLNKKEKYVLDANIKKCFDEINHGYLLKKLKTFPKLEKQVAAWLKAGVLDKGAQQGGVISPLLANIALHGMEKETIRLTKEYKIIDVSDRSVDLSTKKQNFGWVRYGDDFVFLSSSLHVVKVIKTGIEKWLRPIGFELNVDKTQIVNSAERLNDKTAGFEFLGFEIMHRLVSKYRRGKIKKPNKLFIHASKTSKSKHLRSIKNMLKKTQNVMQVVKKLNHLVKKWSNYHCTRMNSKVFQIMDYQIRYKLFKWAKRKHKERSVRWIHKKYFRRVDGRKKFGYELQHSWVYEIVHTDIHIKHHVKVKGEKSPYDGDWPYWGKRNERLIKRFDDNTIKFFKKQKWKCAFCQLTFKPKDIVKKDHIKTKSRGGENEISNLQVLHGHCYETKTQLQKARWNEKH